VVLSALQERGPPPGPFRVERFKIRFLVPGNRDIVGNSGNSFVNKDEFLAVDTDGWIILFRFNGSSWDWLWSTYGTSHSIYPYRFDLRNGGATNGIDYVDSRDEWFFIQNGPSAGWAITEDWSVWELLKWCRVCLLVPVDGSPDPP
jgi:hypothetical protein